MRVREQMGITDYAVSKILLIMVPNVKLQNRFNLSSASILMAIIANAIIFFCNEILFYISDKALITMG